MKLQCPNCGKIQAPGTASYFLGSKWENHIFCTNSHCKHTLIFYTDYWPDNDDWLEHTGQWYRSNPLTTQTGGTNASD